MKPFSFLYLLFVLIPFSTKGQATTVNNSTEKIALQKIALVYRDERQNVTINQLLRPNQFPFKPIKHLNIGITYVDCWLRFALKNATDQNIDLFLALESMVNDSVFLYKVVNQKVVETTIMGENLPFSTRKVKHQVPVFKIQLLPHEQAQYFLKTPGNGQPMNLTAYLLNAEGFHVWDVQKMFFLGIIYGILLLILLLNFSFYLITKEKIYLVFSLQVLFSTLCIIYFDGFIYQYIFPNSGYWANQTIAIALCFTFVFSNRFISDFFNLKQLVPWAYQVFKYTTVLIFIILAFSFVHPWGFNTFIASITTLTSLVAILLLVSILAVKRRGFSSYFFGLVATVGLIIFGTFFQLFVIGLAPDIFFTHYAMHLAVAVQSVFLALAVNDKFRVIREENAYYQIKLVEALNQYSQNLMTNIEAERQRLAVDIHDGLGQNLLTIRNKILRTLKQKSVSAAMQDTLHTLLDITTDTLDDTRAMSYNLRPPILSTMGLTVAIQALVEKMRDSSNLEISLQMPESVDDVVHKDLDINIYRILQEGFSNVMKHAKASKIDLKLVKKEAQLDIFFQDNGVGYVSYEKINGQGILGIKERVTLLGGSINIVSEVGSGTLLFISIPIKNHANN